jgi:pimeloyl-ACP methyl ester carboxylesterase
MKHASFGESMFFGELLVFLLIMYFGIRPLYAAFLFARPPRLRVSYFTPTNLGVTYEDVTLTSQDGVKLSGWYIPSRNKAAVILLHGHSGNRLGVLHQAEALVQAGYGILMFDLRAHGSSGGRRFTRSQAGVDDVLTAVAYLSKRPEINAAGIGVMGVSVGGLFALQAAAQTVAIRAVAADGPSPATLDDVPFSNSLLGRLNLWQERYFRRAIQWFGGHEPLPPNGGIMARLKDRPLLLIATGEGVEAAMAQRLADAVETAVLWQIPEARHAQGWHQRPEEYNHRLVAFFDAVLGRQDNARIALPPLPVEETEAERAEVETPVLRADAASVAEVAVPIDYEATVPMLQANLMAFVMLPLAFLLFWLPYRAAWQIWPFAAFVNTSFGGVLTLVLVLALSLIGHELLHAIGFWLVGGAPLGRIKFGFSWQGFAPYAHCREPLQTTAYRVAVVLPGLFLGVVPGLLGVALRQPLLVMWATLMLLAAGGDVAVLWAVRNVPSTARVLDHPKKVGCQVVAE